MSLHQLSQKDAAELLGTTPRSLRDWEQDGQGIPRNADGTYPPTALVAWWVQRHTGSADDLDAEQERARKDKEAADRLALQNAETRGDVARLSVIERELGMVYADHRANALGIPSRLSPRLVGLNADQIRDRLEGAIYELLTGLADYRPGQRAAVDPAGDPPGTEDGATAAEVHGQPVGRRRKKAEPRK